MSFRVSECVVIRTHTHTLMHLFVSHEIDQRVAYHLECRIITLVCPYTYVAFASYAILVRTRSLSEPPAPRCQT
jgi:hypothetical protein